MQSALLIRLRPRGPWRYGPADGAHDEVDALYRSDRLFSALTLSMQKLGLLDEWLESTARASNPTIALSSLFPFQGDTLFAIPPASIWPPPSNQVTAPNPVFLAKIRWKSVSFVPLPLIDTLLTGGSLLAEQWLPDAESGCLLRRDRPSTAPMRVAIRRTGAVDRLTAKNHVVSSTAVVEFEPNAGLWALARFRDEKTENTWRKRLQGAFRLLADSGFGGRRSSGWGQAHEPEFTRGDWPGFVLPKLARAAKEGSPSSRYWLLSLFVPGTQDAVDWSSGTYQMVTRLGRIENGAGSGAEKKSLRMIAEGSVLEAAREPAGAAPDVAPENFAHPVYRSGLALALELPEITQTAPVEEPSTEEAVIDRPCEPAKEPEPVSEAPQPAIEDKAEETLTPASTENEVSAPPSEEEPPPVEDTPAPLSELGPADEQDSSNEAAVPDEQGPQDEAATPKSEGGNDAV